MLKLPKIAKIISYYDLTSTKLWCDRDVTRDMTPGYYNEEKTNIGKFCREVLFSDESTFTLNNHAGNNYVRRRPEEEYRTSSIRSR